MPVKDLNFERGQFAEAGRIRLGIKKVSQKSGKEYPSDVDYFVLKDALDLVPHYGKQPKELLVYLPYTDIDRNFRIYYEEFRSGGLYCQGDGEHITYAIDHDGSQEAAIRNGKVVREYTETNGERYAIGDRVPCPGMDRDLYERCANCKLRGILFLIVRDPKNPISPINGRMAYYRLSTGSVRNCVDLMAQLRACERTAQYMNQSLPDMTIGLPNLPLILQRVPGSTSTIVDTKDGKARAQVAKHFLQIEVDPAWLTAAYASMAHAVLPAPEFDALPEIASDGPNGDFDTDIPDGDWHTVELDDEIVQTIAQIEDMRELLPENDMVADKIAQDTLEDLYEKNRFYKAVRQRLDLRRNEKLALNADTWQVMCDVMIDTLQGEPF